MSEPRRWWISDNHGNRIKPDDGIKHLYIEVIEAEPILARIKELEGLRDLMLQDSDKLRRLLTNKETQLKEAEEVIRFYASGKHFEWLGKEEFAPENPSGEPSNIECGGDLDCEFTLENGGIAREYLKKWEGK